MSQDVSAPPSSAAHEPTSRADVRQIVLVWAAMTAALELFAIFVPARIMGVAASKTMADIKMTVTVFSIAAAPVAALVWAIALHSLMRWRHRGSGPPPDDGPPIRGNTPVQIVWIVVSSVLCLFLFVWGLVEMQAAAAQPTANALVVDVTGQQWTWTFSYPAAGGYTSSVLYLPDNRPVIFRVTSNDVVHSFWITQMGVKVDANPGQITTVSVMPDRLGTFTARCAELCGLYHAYMVSPVRVLTRSAFTSWLHAHAAPPN